MKNGNDEQGSLEEVEAKRTAPRSWDEREAYGIGVIGPDPRRTDALLVVVFAVAIALSFVFLGVIIIPGVLLVVVIHGAIDRPASVAVTSRGVAILSELNGRPRRS